MTTDIEAITLEVQQTLDELFAESLIPFKLSVGVIEYVGMHEYIVRFYDSRLYSVDVSRQKGQSFKTVFREAILNRVARIRISPQLARIA